MRQIVIALPKGSRMLGRSYEIFKNAGFASSELEQEIGSKERKKLEFTTDDGRAIILLVNIADIPQYVDKNWADIGITAFDCYREYELSHITAKFSMRGDNFKTDVLPDLQLCQNARFCVAGRPETKEFYEKCKVSDEKILEVATQYPKIASKYFMSKGITADIITIAGSSEIMPEHGGVDVIFDIVESGRALQENGLIIFEEAMPIKTKVLVSKAALKYDEKMAEVVEALRNAIK